MANFSAAEAAVGALRAAGRLEQVDEALVTAVLSLAAAVDEYPYRATLWREYRGALAELREVTRGVDDGSLAELLAELSATRGDTAQSGASHQG